MKVLQTPNRFFPDIGGVEQYVLDLGKVLVDSGHEVTVCAVGDGKRHDHVDGIEVHRVPEHFSVAQTRVSLSLILYLFSADYDVMHTHLPTPWTADLSVLISKLRRKRVVLTYHNHIVGDGFAAVIAWLYNVLVLPITLLLCDAIIVTTEEYAQEKRLQKFSKKLVRSSCFLDTDRFSNALMERKRKVIGFLSVLDSAHDYKGLDVLLRAFRRVLRNHKNAELLIGGKGSEKRRYEQIAEGLGISDSVQFLGYIPDDIIADFYADCGVFVLPSTDSEQEGFGIVALEALSVGTPVVVTEHVGVHRDVSNDGGGVVVASGDAVALANGIMNIFTQDDAAFARMQKVSREIALRYDADEVCKGIIEAYEG